jgi:hypothetical protein
VPTSARGAGCADPDDNANKSQIKYSDGLTAFSVAPGSPTYGSKEQLTLRDLSGKPMFVTDEVAGYGISHPGLAYPVWGREELQPGNSAPNAVIVAEGHNAVYNPVWFVSVRLRLAHSIAGTSSVSVFLELRDIGNTVLATSSTVVIPVTGVVFLASTFSKMCVIPESSMANGVTAFVKVHTPTPSDFGVTAYPIQSKGTSRALYDYNPAYT